MHTRASTALPRLSLRSPSFVLPRFSVPRRRQSTEKPVSMSTLNPRPTYPPSKSVAPRQSNPPTGIPCPLSIPLRSPILSRSALKQLHEKDFVEILDAISPALVDGLIEDISRLRNDPRTSSARPDPSRGSVTWTSIWPRLPPGADGESSAREELYDAVGDVKLSIEGTSGIELDSALTDLKYAFYPTGGHYQRHVDGLNVGRKQREFSFVLYLNKGWEESHRGHLRVYGSREVGSSYMDVSPRAGTLVVFKSATVSHEVLATNQRRMCVVGWFNRHVEEDKEADHTSGKSELALAIMEFYKQKGESIKLN